MMKSNRMFHAAAAAPMLGLLAALAMSTAMAQPVKPGTDMPPECQKTPKTCAASVSLFRAQERFRKAYLLENGSCAKPAACSVGVKPNLVGGRPGIIELQLKGALMTCEEACKVTYANDPEGQKLCELGCAGKKIAR